VACLFGIKFIKFQPNVYALKYKSGKIVKEGAGISFFYYAPTTSLVAVPIVSVEAPFIFEEVTADFQTISVQGHVTFKVADPQKIARLLNYTLESNGKKYNSDDPDKLAQRIINAVRVLVKKELAAFSLRDALKASEKLPQSIIKEINHSSELNSLGIEILGMSILAIKSNQETARALEAQAREQILKEADDAIYQRRNAAVEQERVIKENELNTEIAIENKKRQIRETQLEAERAVQEKQHQLKEAEINFQIIQEERRKNLVELETENEKAVSDAKAYQIAAMMHALEGADPIVIQALTNVGMAPNKLIALAFQELAAKADKIGQLNISPDLMKELLERSK
jgi:regulator of protease activity HflC (stomatin/prohibitin superfamily)